MRKWQSVLIVALVVLVSQAAFATGGNEAPKAGGVVKIVMERPLWSNSNPADAPLVRIREAVKKAIGIDVEVVGQPNPTDEWEKPNLMLAAGEPLDIFQVPTDPTRGWRKYKADGLVVPLNDLLNKYGANLLKKMDPTGVKNNTDADGKIWAMADEQPAQPLYIVARKDWMDKYNIKLPAQPTMQDYENMMAQFKKEGDQGFVPSWQGTLNVPTCIVQVLAGAYIPTSYANYLDSDGKIKPFHVHPGMKDVLAKMKDWYAKGYLHKEYFTMTYQQFNDAARGGKSGLFLTWAGMNINAETEMLKKSVPTGDFTWVPAPKDKYGPLMVYGLPNVADIMITKSSKNPDAAMKFLDWSQATDTGWLLTKYGEEGTDYSWADKTNGILKLLDVPPEKKIAYAAFASTRLLYYMNRYSQSILNLDGAKYVNDTKRFPGIFAADFDVPYDTSVFKSRSQLDALNTIVQAAVAKITMGQIPLSEWDTAMAQWYKAGGQDYIDDMTAQYKVLHKK